MSKHEIGHVLSNHPSSDVFAYLARFLPKRTDVLWVAQELERIHRLPDLAQQSEAQQKLYVKIERHIIATGKLFSLTTNTLREKIQAQFPSEVHEGFLKPVFFKTSTKKKNTAAKNVRALPTKNIASQQASKSTEKPLTFSQIKKQNNSTNSDSVIAHVKTSSGKMIPVSLKSVAAKSEQKDASRYVVAIKNLQTAQHYLKDRVQMLTQALEQALKGDISGLIALESQDDGLQACIKMIKEIEYDRQDKALKIDALEQAVLTGEHDTTSQSKQVERLQKMLSEAQEQLQQQAAEVAAIKQQSVERELRWQSRILELEQAKQAAVERELALQKHVAEMEKSRQEAVTHELTLQQRIAQLEQAKQTALKQQQQVARMKQEIEAFYHRLSKES